MTEDQDDDDEGEGEVEAEEQIEFGRGLANYNSQEIDKIKGHKRCATFAAWVKPLLLHQADALVSPDVLSSEIEKILGYIEAEHCVESITSLKRLVL